LALNRWKGLGSIIGLAVSLFVIIGFIVRKFLAGQDPFWTIIVGAMVIMVITMYLAHGFTKTNTYCDWRNGAVLILCQYFGNRFCRVWQKFQALVMKMRMRCSLISRKQLTLRGFFSGNYYWRARCA